MTLMTHVFDRWQGKATEGQRRNRRWPSAKKAYKKRHPRCEACKRGGKWSTEVHHVIPFQLSPHIDELPDGHPDQGLELNPTNMITLCVGKLRGGGCHLMLGHGMNYQTVNPSVRSHAALVRTMIENVRRI